MKDKLEPCQQNAPFMRADLEYVLPDALIAQQPLAKRDASRMLVLHRATGEIHDAGVVDLLGHLRPGDLLVLNDTKVLPAKFQARRATGGKVNGLFETEEKPGTWRVMLAGSRRLRAGERLTATAANDRTITLTLIEDYGSGRWRIEVEAEGSAEDVLTQFGQTPLPPYIKRGGKLENFDAVDRARYQTVYAKKPGAVAAPTAGLHLTEPLLAEVGRKGIDVAFVTLHVGAGTFNPIRSQDLSNHEMHSEWYALSVDTAKAVTRCKERGGRVVAVGTTSVRVLETSAKGSADGCTVEAGEGMTDLFLFPDSPSAPAKRFGVVDLMLTNFHLPGSTLLALVMAFGGVDAVRRAYTHAIEHGYRFYSYGDAMLIE